MYSEKDLKKRIKYFKKWYSISKKYKKLGKINRLPNIPEDISENIMKFAIKKNDTELRELQDNLTWDCPGDLISFLDSKKIYIECKSFSSGGPTSFSPKSKWDVIYFLDLRKGFDEIIVYRVNLSAEKFKHIKVSKKDTFEDQCNNGRRPRVCWDTLYPQIKSNTSILFKGDVNLLF